MKIIAGYVSRKIPAVNSRLLAEARAVIALHHFTRFTGGRPTMERLSEGLKARGITRSTAATEESKHTRYLSHQQCPKIKNRQLSTSRRF